MIVRRALNGRFLGHAYVYFPGNVPWFHIVPQGADPDDNHETVLIQTDWDYPGVASNMGWRPCEKCNHTDGTVNCDHRTANEMISEAYDFIRKHEGEPFTGLDDYLDYADSDLGQ